MRIFNAQIVTPQCLVARGCVEVNSGRITAVLPVRDGGDVDLEGNYLVPGFVDLHTHPAPQDGESPDALAGLCDELRDAGTAGFLFAFGNVATGRLVDRCKMLRACIEAVGPDRGCLGIHLEGPYVAEEARGGFERASITDPRSFPVEPLLDACGPWARYINISPEVPGAMEAIRTCRERGIAVSIGHSVADAETLHAAVDAGARSVCHLFNTGQIMRFQEPGVLDVTLDLLGLASDQLTCEVICDGVHVDPMLVRLLFRAKGAGRIALITDSILGGRYAEEGRAIETGVVSYQITGGVGRNSEGGLVGSTLNMVRAFRNFVHFTGCSIAEAARASALTPARLLNLDADYGAIEQGRRALFCVLDENLEAREDLNRLVNGPF